MNSEAYQYSLDIKNTVEFFIKTQIKFRKNLPLKSKKVHEQNVYLFTFCTRAQNFSNLDAIIKNFRYSLFY